MGFNAELFVKATCQSEPLTPLLKLPPPFISLPVSPSQSLVPLVSSLSSRPSPRVLLIINYVIIPTRWLITGPPSLRTAGWRAYNHAVTSRGQLSWAMLSWDLAWPRATRLRLSSAHPDWWSFNREQRRTTTSRLGQIKPPQPHTHTHTQNTHTKHTRELLTAWHHNIFHVQLSKYSFYWKV